MKKYLILLALLSFTVGCNIKIEPTSNANITVSQNGNSVDIKVQQSNSNTTVSNNQPSEKKPENAADKPKETADTSSGDMKTVKIYLSCNGKMPSADARNRKIKNTPGILKATLETLLKDEESGCINFTENLSLDLVSMEQNGLAVIRLKGTNSWIEQGQRDNPNFCNEDITRLVEKTARQFPTVKEVMVFQNDIECGRKPEDYEGEEGDGN